VDGVNSSAMPSVSRTFPAVIGNISFVVIRKHACFRRIYQRHRRQGKGPSNAQVIVARHLARVIWRFLTDGRQFVKRPAPQ